MAVLFRARGGAQFVENADAVAGADARSAGGDQGFDGLQGANAAGSFDAGAIADDRTHEGHVGDRRAGGAEAGRRFDEIGALVDGNLADLTLLVIGQEAGFRNHLGDHVGRAAGLGQVVNSRRTRSMSPA